MISHLHSYFELGISYHEIINVNQLIDLCHDVEYIIFSYFVKIKTKEYQICLVNVFIN